MARNNTRRSFLRDSVLSGGLVTGGLSVSRKSNAKTKKIPLVELLKVGVIGVGEYSHMPTIWGPTINPSDPESWPIRSTRMKMTHVWDSRPEKAEEFAKKSNDTISRLLRSVNAI